MYRHRPGDLQKDTQNREIPSKTKGFPLLFSLTYKEEGAGAPESNITGLKS